MRGPGQHGDTGGGEQRRRHPAHVRGQGDGARQEHRVNTAHCPAHTRRGHAHTRPHCTNVLVVR